MMRLALQQAQIAWQHGEVPVGAVVVDAQGQVLGEGFNRVIMDADPTAHAEVVALRAAARQCLNYRLPGLRLYVTLEPCMMCVGAMVHARLAEVYYGAPDPKTGACVSVLNVSAIAAFNHHTVFHGGVLAEPCGDLLRHFFRARRCSAGSQIGGHAEVPAEGHAGAPAAENLAENPAEAKDLPPTALGTKGTAL
jgi:tRNA(adenine34) deaminase